LCYWGIDKLPAHSTLSDANINRHSEVFGMLYHRLYEHYKPYLSDSPEGIKTQIWVALIANLIFTVTHRQVKECELFITILSMAPNNLSSYACLITLIKRKHPTGDERNIRIVQLNMFKPRQGGGFAKPGKSP